MTSNCHDWLKFNINQRAPVSVSLIEDKWGAIVERVHEPKIVLVSPYSSRASVRINDPKL